jgi:hypothetical protein
VATVVEFETRLWWGLAVSIWHGFGDSSVLAEIWFHSFNLLYKEYLNFLCLIAICEDHSAINCVTVQHKYSFPSSLMGHIQQWYQ